MKITIIVEGKTEKAFLPHLRNYLRTRLPEMSMPNLDIAPYNHRIPTGEQLRKDVNALFSGRDASDHVIALTDVYTGAVPPLFSDAADARSKMRQWVGNNQRFHPHAAQYEFEAWLLPYWPRIQQLAKHNQTAPRGNPERVNHNNPPSRRLKEIFRRGEGRDDYSKRRDADRILQGQDLNVTIQQCPELKSLMNTILRICGGQTIP